MMEKETIPCPGCDKNMEVGKIRNTYVSEDCPNCKLKAGRIERWLNQKKKHAIKMEKSYFKLDPRG